MAVVRLGGIFPLLLLLWAGGARAQPTPYGVEITFVAPEGSEYQQMEAHFSLDGRPLAVPDDSRPGQRYLLFAGDLPPGDHRLRAELQYRRGEDSFFSRKTHAVVEVKGSADFTVEAGSHLRIVGRILERTDPDHGTELPTFVVGMSRTAPSQVPEVAAQPPPAPKPAPVVEKKPEPKAAPVAEKKPEPKPAPVVEKKPEPKPAPVAEKKPEPKPAPVAEQKPAPPAEKVAPASGSDQGKVEEAVAKREPPRAKRRRRKKKPPMTAMERLRARLRSGGGHPKPAANPKPEPAKKEDPAVARLRELLRKSVRR